MKKIKILLIALACMLCWPVTAEAAEAPEYGSLTIYNQNTEGEPISGVEYTVWQVDERGGYRPATAAEAKEHLLNDSRQSKKSDAAGKAVFTSLPAGIYYVTESDLGDINASAFANAPFIVEIPMTNEAGTGWITDVEVYLKNQVLGIDQFVNGAGGENYNSQDINQAKHRPVSGDETFGYTILSYFPGEIGSTAGESYVVTDKINKSVTCDPETLKVYAVPNKDTAVQDGYLLTEGLHFEKTFDQASNMLTASLTDAGMRLLSQRNGTAGDRFLLLKFDCQLNGGAVNGVNLYSEATLTYQKGTAAGSRTFTFASTVREDAENLLTVKVADEPEVHTGQIGVVKVNAKNEKQKLADAVFGIAASKAEAEAGKYISTGTTDENGYLSFQGLSYGQAGDDCEQNSGDTTYWLVEVEAPSGYSRVTDPIEVTFQYQQADDGEFYFAMVTVHNQPSGKVTPGDPTKPGTSKGTKTVKTGDLSPVLLMSALLLISAAVILIIWKKKKMSAQ